MLLHFCMDVTNTKLKYLKIMQWAIVNEDSMWFWKLSIYMTYLYTLHPLHHASKRPLATLNGIEQIVFSGIHHLFITSSSAKALGIWGITSSILSELVKWHVFFKHHFCVPGDIIRGEVAFETHLVLFYCYIYFVVLSAYEFLK